MSERDTHFTGFAKLLVADLERRGFLASVHGAYPYTLIARRAYDLVRYVLTHTPASAEIDEDIRTIPDLTAWPESEQEQ